MATQPNNKVGVLMADKRSPRVLLYDLETSFNVVAAFQLKQDGYIPHTNVLKERFIISVAWQWLGESKVHATSVLDDAKRFAKDPSDDLIVVKRLHALFSEADVVIAHNGSNFDDKYVLTRCLYHGLDPLPPVVSIDTCKVAKSRFLFNSNSLDYLGKFLKVGKKKDTPSGLWLKALAGDKQAIRTMVDYNKQDTLLLGRVFKKLLPYIPNYVNRELYGGTGCPRCGSTKVQSRGTYYAQTRTYRRWQCMGECKGWYRTLKSDKESATKHRVV
jgi:RNase H-like protein